MTKLVILGLIAALVIPVSETVATNYYQADLIPESVWAQYPLILIFAFVAGFVARQWMQGEREWRQFVQEERQQFVNAQMEIMRWAFEEASAQQLEAIMAKMPQYSQPKTRAK